jgi:DNA-dependent RNA polymerase auxiliary subunit epsilon
MTIEMKPKEENNMTVRMKTKQADYKIEFVEGMNGTQEKSVTIWYDSRAEEYIVSNTPQTLLGMSPYHTRVHSGPYSHWIRPFDKSELKS